ncbi:MAG: flavin reductase [Paraprevotella sp.]|nr:flavin reductase [Paraprevotella sp.]
MKKVEISNLTENFFETIGKEWMLVTAGTPGRFNTMTASWGGIGWLWNKPVAFVFIRPERYTFGFAEQEEFMTLAFLGKEKEMRNIYNLCGSKSGRDTDKVKESGLKVLETDGGQVTFGQARLTLVCRKLYADDLKENAFTDKSVAGQWYGEKGGYHKMYVMEITEALIP